MQNQIPKNWQEVELGNLLGQKGYIRGPFGSSLRRGELLEEGIPVYEQQNAIENTRNFRFFIDNNKFTQLKRFAVKPNDLIVSCSGSFGKVSIISEDDPIGIISQALLILRPDINQILPKYLYYFLISSAGYNALASRSTGSALVNIAKREIIEEIKLFVPSLPLQKSIVKILSGFDDKIEVNNKIAKTSEEMAQALFKEWFVKFRFPGYERAEFVDSELGKIPKGWEVKKINDVAKINKGISYSSEEIKDNSVGLPMINLANFQRGGGFNPDGIKFYTGRYKTTDLVKPGDIVIAMTDLTSNREVIGHPARVPSYIHWDKMLISLDVCAVDTEKLYMEFLYYLMLRKEFSYLMASSAGGTNVAHLSKSVIENYSFILPERNLIQEFQDFIRPIFSQINRVELENQKLAVLRDLLLPKLMKGEIRL